MTAPGTSLPRWIVGDDEAGLRLDKFLAASNRLGSRSRVVAALERAKVFVNEVEATLADASARIATGDVVSVWMDRPGTARKRRGAFDTGDLRILHEDDSLIVLDKPAGLLAVPLDQREAAPSAYDLVEDHLRSHGKRRPLVVHRIDQDTSGLVVFAKQARAHQDLKAQFRRREPERVYWAVVYGRPEPSRGTWRDRLVWDQKARIQKETHPDDPSGMDAICDYDVLETFPDASLVEVRLHTGKRNQIRIQARLRGHTLVGERRYVFGPSQLRPIAFPRHALHAYRLAFRHPADGRLLAFEAPLPDDFREAARTLAWRESRPREVEMRRALRQDELHLSVLEVSMAIRLTVVTAVTGLVLAALGAPAQAQAQLPDGEAVFQKACASCHLQPAADSRAPNRDALRAISPEAIVTALTSGNMFRQGAELSDAERRAVAGFLAGRPVGSPSPPSIVGCCTSAAPSTASLAAAAGWNGWGGAVANTRYQPADRGGLTAPQVPGLKLKWAFGFAGVNSARAQPAVAGGRLFVASDNGDVHALSAKTGCTYWTYHAQAGIRTAISVGPYTGANGTSGYAVYFADGGAVAYAVDASTGRQIWTRKVDEHPYAGATGSPTLHAGRLYVPASAVGEEGQGGRAQYQCCTFRGSVSALDANTGAVVWKSYVITEEPKPRSRNKEGVQTWGPAGGGIWSAPTIDAARRAVYVATGNGYADPPQPTTDAVIALDMDTGRVRWVNQPIPNDVFAGGCRANNADNPNCPEKLGPDYDFSMSPVLAKRSTGQDVLIVQQKAGVAYAFDPDKQGALVWQYRTGMGSGLGGQWGAAADATQAYFGVADTLSKTPGGMRAVRIDTGEEVWSKPPAERLCGTVRGCSAAQGAAVTAIPGVVFSASMDGGVRAYASSDGAVVWQFDTNREFETVNGVPAKGGAIDGPGAVVADGMLYVNSGYVSLIGRPGNVLLAFGVD